MWFFIVVSSIALFFKKNAMEQGQKGKNLEQLRAKVQLASLRVKFQSQDYISPREITNAIIPMEKRGTPMEPLKSPRFQVSPRMRFVLGGQSPKNPYSPRFISPRSWNSEQLLAVILSFYEKQLNKTDNPEKVATLLKQYSNSCKTPLIHQCASVNNIIFAEWLKAQNIVYLKERDELGRSAMHETSDVHFAQWLLDQLTEQLNTDEPKKAYLLEKKLNIIDAEDKDKRTPLFIAALCDFTDFVNFLLMHRANIYKKDAFGGTVLHFGIGSAKTLTVILNALISRFDSEQEEDAKKTLKAFVNIPDNNKQTPLHAVFTKNVCTEQERIEIVGLLLTAGADPTRVDAQGKTALHILIANPYISLYEKQCIALRLLDAGADVNKKDADDQTVLHIIMYEKIFPDTHILAKLFIDHGALIDIVDKKKKTSLSLAKNTRILAASPIELHEYLVPVETSSLDQKTNTKVSLFKALQNYRELYLKNLEIKEREEKAQLKKEKKEKKKMKKSKKRMSSDRKE